MIGSILGILLLITIFNISKDFFSSKNKELNRGLIEFCLEQGNDPEECASLNN